jgi:histidinol phosphatase-like enzyme
MLLEAARKFNIDLSASWMVGDDARDVLAGKAAGCKTALIAGDGADPLKPPAPDCRCASLRAFTETLFGTEKTP